MRRWILTSAMLLLTALLGMSNAYAQDYNGQIETMPGPHYKMAFLPPSGDAFWHYYQRECRALYPTPVNRPCSHWADFLAEVASLNPTLKNPNLIGAGKLYWVPVPKGTREALHERDGLIGTLRHSLAAATSTLLQRNSTIETQGQTIADKDSLISELRATIVRWKITSGALAILLLLAIAWAIVRETNVGRTLRRRVATWAYQRRAASARRRERTPPVPPAMS